MTTHEVPDVDTDRCQVGVGGQARRSGHASEGGRDQFGRKVANSAGIDLADGTFWDALRMVDNDWVTVTFLTS
jgi:hypothetical protein